MAGIYVHIPYCRKACIYCDFHFSTSLQSMPEMVDCIIKEIHLRHHEISTPITTLYFGGGTPSLLEFNMLERIFEALAEHFILDLEEITLECNPDDVTIEKLASWKKAGINRLSIGIQSFEDVHLKWMNRSHNSDQAVECLEHAQAAGYNNITIDLIYGFDGLSDEQLLKNLSRINRFDIPHISTYAMTIEPKTVLGHWFQKGKYLEVEDEKVNRQFNLLMDYLGENGFNHYEISNFARPGFKAMHNFNYWNNVPYLGFGPGAHSYLLTKRVENVSHNIKYIKALNGNKLLSTTEQLTSQDLYHEYILVSLRTSRGISESYLTQHHSEYLDHFNKEVGPFLGEFITFSEAHYKLTRRGKHLADYIASRLFLT